MGIDYYSCNYCGKTFPDCGHYVYCNDDCGRHWCSDSCASEEGRRQIDDDTDPNSYNCNFCRKEDVDDHELFKFLMKTHKLTRKKLLKMYLEAKKKKK